MACHWIVGIAKIFTNDSMEPREIINIEIYRPKFILRRHVFYCTWLASILEVCRLRTVQLVLDYSIHVPGWLQKWLNLITAPGSVSNEPGSVTWLATKYLKTVSWRNHTEKLTTCWAQNISFWLKINIPSSYFTILMLNCLETTLKLQFDSYVTAVRFLT